jgi:hypothetical protein
MDLWTGSIVAISKFVSEIFDAGVNDIVYNLDFFAEKFVVALVLESRCHFLVDSFYLLNDGMLNFSKLFVSYGIRHGPLLIHIDDFFFKELCFRYDLVHP